LIGYVDETKRALIDIKVRAEKNTDFSTVTAWVDTAFNGHLVFSKELIEVLRLQREAATEAILADGSVVILESFACVVEWGEETIVAQVIANDGKLRY
jgi:clan AA aspartic protease